jgi:hypothetical protein
VPPLPQVDRYWLTCLAILMTMQGAFYGMPNSAAHRMHRALKISYQSLAKHLRGLENPSLWDLSWRIAPVGSWTASTGLVQHGVREFSTGEFIPRDVGNADAIRHGLLANLVRDSPPNNLAYLHDLCNKTAPMRVSS